MKGWDWSLEEANYHPVRTKREERPRKKLTQFMGCMEYAVEDDMKKRRMSKTMEWKKGKRRRRKRPPIGSSEAKKLKISNMNAGRLWLNLLLLLTLTVGFTGEFWGGEERASANQIAAAVRRASR